jgi:sugar phosphate isomerase/epimerase
MNDMNIGIQLYSVRDEIEKYGLDAVLESLKLAGCNAVEFAGFYGLTPEEMKSKLEKYGLRPLSAHIGIDSIIPSLPYIDALAIKEVYIPGYPTDKLKDEAGYGEFLAKVKKVKAELDMRGVTFGYHNHARELEGEDLIDKMTRDIPGFYSELDIYWAHAAGRSSTELIEKYGSRLSALHIKDMDKNADPKSPRELPNAIIGEGQCSAEECFNRAADNGVRTFIIEVEFYPTVYTEYIKQSCENINNFIKRRGN